MQEYPNSHNNSAPPTWDFGKSVPDRCDYRWEGRHLTDPNWQPMGIAMEGDPAMFGINQDPRYFLGTLPVAAPEIILHEGRYYIAALNEGALDGIRIARLRWVKPS